MDRPAKGKAGGVDAPPAFGDVNSGKAIDGGDVNRVAGKNQLLPPTKTTVKRKVLDHLKRGAHLTPGDAWIRYNTSRLAACIHSLRRDGHDIRAETVEVTCADGRLARVARYSLP